MFTLTNQGDPCSLEGYPTATFFAPAKQGAAGAGSRLSLTDIDSGPPATTVSVSKGGRAEFIVVYHDVPVGGVGCLTVGSIDVVLPGATTSLVATLSIPVCGGSVEIYAVGPPGTEHP